MDLDEWLYINRLTRVEFAGRCGISRPHLYCIMRGKLNKGLTRKGVMTMRKICKQTNGQVTLLDLVVGAEKYAKAKSLKEKKRKNGKS